MRLENLELKLALDPQIPEDMDNIKELLSAMFPPDKEKLAKLFPKDCHFSKISISLNQPQKTP